MNRPLVVGALATFAAIAAGCPPPPNHLDGSIKSSHDLTFERVELRYFSDQLAYELAYFHALDEAGTQEDIVAKVVFNEPAGGVVVDTPIDLTTPEADAEVERITAAGDPFPSDLDSGSVTFATAPVVGETVTGEFAVTFSNGKTLFGGFETPLGEASFE